MLRTLTTRPGPNSRVRRESGASAVEFALVLPVLLMLVFGIIQFGFILAQQVALNGAVRSGARFGSVNAYAGTHTCGAVINEVQNDANTIGMGGSGVTVKVFRTGSVSPICDSQVPSTLPGVAPCIDPAAPVDTPDTLTVQAQFVSNFIVPVPLAGNSITLHSSGSYECEYSQ